MTFFFALSKYIVLPILYDWLSLVDFVKLDGSLTNHKLCNNLPSLCWKYHDLFQASFLDGEFIDPQPGQTMWFNKMKLIASKCEISEALLIKLSRRPSRVSRLMAWLKGTKMNPKSVILPLFKDAKSIALTGYLLNDYGEEIVDILNSCRNIIELTINVYYAFSRDFNLSFCSPIAIKVLRVMHPARNEYLQPLLRCCCYHLMEIHIDSRNPSSDTISTLFVIVWCRNLHTFNFTIDYRYRYCLAFHCGQKARHLYIYPTDTLMRALLWYRCSDSLTTLTLAGPLKVWKENWAILMRSLCPKLAIFSLYGYATLKHILPDLAVHLPQIKVLNCTLCSLGSDGAGYLFSSQLPILSIAVAGKISPQVVLQLSSYCAVQTLDLNPIYDFARWCGVTDEGLSLVARFCPLITDLNLIRCILITDNGILPIIKNKRLKKLSLNETKLHSETLFNLSQYCILLEDLEPPIHYEIDGILALIANCTCLRRLRCKDSIEGINEAIAIAKLVNPRLRITTWNEYRHMGATF